jgi:hypothetical protein
MKRRGLEAAASRDREQSDGGNMEAATPDVKLQQSKALKFLQLRVVNRMPS